ncbi:MAG: hypothetical protein ABSB90_09855 [Thermoplasmata archaeon]
MQGKFSGLQRFAEAPEYLSGPYTIQSIAVRDRPVRQLVTESDENPSDVEQDQRHRGRQR